MDKKNVLKKSFFFDFSSFPFIFSFTILFSSFCTLILFHFNYYARVYTRTSIRVNLYNIIQDLSMEIKSTFHVFSSIHSFCINFSVKCIEIQMADTRRIVYICTVSLYKDYTSQKEGTSSE